MTRIKGSKRADVLEGHGHNDVVHSLQGNDIIRDARVHSNDQLFGGSGDDFIFSHTGSDLLKGGKGDDAFEVLGHYNVTVVGGPGEDVLYLEGSTEDYKVVTHGDHVLYRYEWHDHSHGEHAIEVSSVEQVKFTDNGFPL